MGELFHFPDSHLFRNFEAALGKVDRPRAMAEAVASRKLAIPLSNLELRQIAVELERIATFREVTEKSGES